MDRESFVKMLNRDPSNADVYYLIREYLSSKGIEEERIKAFYTELCVNPEALFTGTLNSVLKFIATHYQREFNVIKLELNNKNNDIYYY